MVNNIYTNINTQKSDTELSKFHNVCHPKKITRQVLKEAGKHDL